MDDNEFRTVVPRHVLVKQGLSAITYLSGGVFLLIMVIFGRGFLGILLSVIALVVGIFVLLSRDQIDRKPGLILTVAGVLGMIIRFRIPIPLIQPFAGTVLSLGAVGLFAAGIWKGIRFLLGLKSRQ